MDFLKFIGERILRRIQAGEYPSVERFAHENRIPKSTLSELLNGKNDPKLTTLAKICAGLEIPLSELFREPEIDLWVRENAPHYDPRAPKGKPRKPIKKSVKKS